MCTLKLRNPSGLDVSSQATSTTIRQKRPRITAAWHRLHQPRSDRNDPESLLPDTGYINHDQTETTQNHCCTDSLTHWMVQQTLLFVFCLPRLVTWGTCNMGTAELFLTSGTCNIGTAELFLTWGTYNIGTAELFLTSGTCNIGTAELFLTSGTCNIGTAELFLTWGTYNIGTAELFLTWGTYNIGTAKLFLHTAQSVLSISSYAYFTKQPFLHMTMSKLFTKQASPSCISYSNHQPFLTAVNFR